MVHLTFVVLLSLFISDAYGTEKTLGAAEATAWLAAYDKRPEVPWPAKVKSKADLPKGDEELAFALQILTETSRTVGPNAPNAMLRLTHNNLNCIQCHPSGASDLPGTRRSQLPFVGVVQRYPRFDAKAMRIITLEDRIRGMFGANKTELPDQSRAITALIHYFKFLSPGAGEPAPLEGGKYADLPPLSRAADPSLGKKVFETKCLTCHGPEGLGVKNPDFDKGAGYAIPPIAGDDTFHDGGHLYLVPILARFIYGYMPKGATPANPQLSPEEAYDVAAYIDHVLPRKKMLGRSNLYPNAQFRPAFFAIPELFPGDEKAYFRAKFGPFTKKELMSDGT